MTDEVKEDVIESGVEIQQVAENTQAPQEQLSDKEKNIRIFRERNALLESQIQMMQARLQEVENRSNPPQSNLNYADDDVPTWGEVKRVLAQKDQDINSLKQMMAETKLRTQYSDFEETVREFLPEVLQQDAELALAIKDNPHMQKLAYKLAQANPRYHQKKLAVENQPLAQKMVDNASKVTPASARKTMMVQDEDSKIASMSDKDLWNLFNTAKARA